LRLLKNDHASTEPWTVEGVRTELPLMVPPALCKVEPKTAKKIIGAMMDLNAKRYWILVYGMHRNGSCRRK
jgi:hypothetical protein